MLIFLILFIYYIYYIRQGTNFKVVDKAIFIDIHTIEKRYDFCHTVT